MKVRLALRALSEAERCKTWWLTNRPLTPELFDEEIAAAIERIGAGPGLGAIYPSSFDRTVRRVLMPRTKNHVYYVVRESEVVVLSVWGAPRAKGPKVQVPSWARHQHRSLALANRSACGIGRLAGLCGADYDPGRCRRPPIIASRSPSTWRSRRTAARSTSSWVDRYRRCRAAHPNTRRVDRQRASRCGDLPRSARLTPRPRHHRSSTGIHRTVAGGGENTPWLGSSRNPCFFASARTVEMFVSCSRDAQVLKQRIRQPREFEVNPENTAMICPS